MKHMHLVIAAATAIGLCADLTSAPLPQSGPQLTSLSDASAPRSGRLVAFGAMFGATPGQLLVDGQPGIVTKWSDTEVHGYVPESASLGLVAVKIATAGGNSEALPLSVTTRVRPGRITWAFRTDSSRIGPYLAKAPDGTVYTTDNERMYALSADGELLWVQPAGASTRQVSVGSDGTIYTGGTSSVIAVNPDGSVKWTYQSPFATSSIEAGPAVGPDGNVYAFQDASRSGGLGVFSLDPNGNLRWNDLPSPLPTPDINKAPIRFSAADARFYFGIVSIRSGPYPRTFAFDFNGSQLWTRDGTCSTGPLLDPQGRLVLGGIGSCGITVLDPDNNQIWNTPPPELLSFPVGPAVGPDGSVYMADWTGAELWSVDANGNTRWFLPASSSRGIMKNLAVTPDSNVLLDGGRLTFGVPGWIRAYSTTDGSFLWQENLTREAGYDQETYFRPIFSADGRTAYYNSEFLGNGPGYGYVYAVSVTDHATWSNYGDGVAGALGVPALTASANPVMGSQVQVLCANGAGSDTAAAVLLGVAPAAIPTSLLGVVLVNPIVAVPVQVPTAGLAMNVTIPAESTLTGSSVYLQDLQIDSGAVRGVSFSRGLELTLGVQ